MGRFFRTTNGQQLDFMSKLPVDLMMRGIQTTDAANDELYQQTDLFGNAVAKINHLTPDAERVKAIQQQYQQRIEEVTKALQENPTDYRKQMPLVKNLSRELTNDMTNGEIAAIQSNASKLAEWDKIHKPLVGAKDGISPEAYTAMKSAFINKYSKEGGTAYDPQTGNYKQLTTENAHRTQDASKILKDTIGEIKATVYEDEKTLDDNGFLKKYGVKKEGITQGRLYQMAMDTLMSNQEYMGYVKQGGKYGYLKGVFDENGNFIDPLQRDKDGKALIDKTDIDPLTGKPVGNPIFNPNSFLAQPIRGFIAQKAYEKVSKTEDWKVNPYTLEKVQQANDIQKIEIQDSNHKENFLIETGIKQANAKELMQLKADLDSQNEEKKLAAKQKLKDKATNPNTNTLIVNPDGEFTWNPKDNPDGKITNDDIMKDIVGAKARAVANNTLANDPNLSVNERNLYKAKALAAEEERRQKSELAYAARVDVNEKLLAKGYSQDDIKSLNNITGTISSLKSQREKVFEQWKKAGANYSHPLAYQVDKLDNAISRTEKLRRTSDNLANDWFKNNAEKTKFQVTRIGTDVKQQQDLFGYIAANPSIFKALDMRGQSSDNKESTWKKDKDFPEFGGTVEEMMKKFNIVGINSPTAGIPASITLRTKGQEGGLIQSERKPDDFIVPIPQDVQTKLGLELSKSTDSKKKALGNMYLNNAKAVMVANFNDRIIDYNKTGLSNSPIGYSEGAPLKIKDHSGNTVTYTPKFRVIPKKDKSGADIGNLDVFQGQVSLPNGTWSTLGEFNSPENFADKILEIQKGSTTE